MARGLVKTGAKQSISFEDSPLIPHLLPCGSALKRVTSGGLPALSLWLLFHIPPSRFGFEVSLFSSVTPLHPFQFICPVSVAAHATLIRGCMDQYICRI
jgi:hypothetical protein